MSRIWMGLVVLVAVALAGLPLADARNDEEPVKKDPVDSGFGVEGAQEEVDLAESGLVIPTSDLVAGSPATEDHDVHPVVVGSPPPCAKWSTPTSTSTDDGSGSLSYEDAEKLAAEQKAREQELLDASTYGRSGPMSNGDSDKATDGSRGIGLGGRDKIDKRAVNQSHLSARFFQGVDVDAVFDIWADIKAKADAALDALNPSGGGGSGEPSEPVCVAAYFCYGERIDDVRFGHLSDEPDGAFYEYVSTIGAYIDFVEMLGRIDNGETDLTLLGESITSASLDDSTSLTAMPVFFFCRNQPVNEDRDPVAPVGPIELAADGFFPTVTWTATVEGEYDIPAARIESLEDLNTALKGRRPQIRTVPPADKGFTFVQFPMWLWIEDPLTFAKIEAVSEEGTVRLSTRATLVDVTWKLGDTTVVCTLDEMETYVPTVSDPTDTPECTHTFDELVDYTMTATARYEVEEQVSYSGTRDAPFPETVWLPHPDSPEVFIETVSPQMSVHQIVSVNVPLNATDEEISALVATRSGD